MIAYTGGELNELNGKMGISDPKRSVPIMRLIRNHKPKSKDALVQLIEYHKNNKCDCGVIRTGTVLEFGERLYDSQIKYWGEQRYTLAQCIQWEYDLFVVQSLKGGMMEKKALIMLQKELPNLYFEEAEGYLDDELRVDLLVFDKNKNIKGGIQVKPKTFKSMRPEVLFMQKKQNDKWNYPVWFLFYNKDESFHEIQELIEKLKKN
ncbi:MjaI family restriction endonuclease [Flavobacteriaceae bacterium]|nr:MjaI family restriction endonuclease [Flavobacteriaceae bacterium]